MTKTKSECNIILPWLDKQFRQQQHLVNDVEMKCEHYFDLEEEI